MYANQNSPDISLYLIAGAAQVIAPLIMLALFLWLIAKAGFFLVCILSADGGMSAREQRQRHKLENWAARMAVLCFIAAVGLLVMGQSGEGTIHITLPGNIKIENAGTPLVLLGIGNSLIYMLLKLRGSEDTDKAKEKIASNLNDGADDPQPLTLLGNMRYWHVGLMTVGLLPFLKIFAIPVGALLAWGVAKRRT